MATWAAVAVLALAWSKPVVGQQRSNWDNFKREIDWAGDDLVRIWSAPAHIDGNDLPPLLGVTATGLLLSIYDEKLYDWMVKHQDEFPVQVLKPFREGQLLNRVGRTYVQVPLSVGLYVAGLISDDATLRDAGIGCATANLSTTLPRATFSRFVGRRRPMGEEGAFTFKPFTFNDWSYYSFPGGHVSNIMACASFWSHRLELGPAEPALYALATAIGLGRVVDGAHWTSDTWFGMAIGLAVGRLVADRMLDRRAADELATIQQFREPIFIGWSIPF
jgi:hypothetical protein